MLRAFNGKNNVITSLNASYKEIDLFAKNVLKTLEGLRFKCSLAYFNGHYCKGENGLFEYEHYPIPVISVAGLCDVEIDFDDVGVTAKLGKDAALDFDYGKLRGYPFEAYGVQDYLADYYVDGMTLQQLKANVRASSETEIGFSFRLGKYCPAENIAELVKLLKEYNFYY